MAQLREQNYRGYTITGNRSRGYKTYVKGINMHRFLMSEIKRAIDFAVFKGVKPPARTKVFSWEI